MSFRNAIFVTLLVGITHTIFGHAEHAPHSLVDLAHSKWKKKRITWGIVSEAFKNKQNVIEGIRAAFGKWAAVTSLHFDGPVDEPDIKIKIVPSVSATGVCKTIFVDDGYYENRIHILDYGGVTIIFGGDINWTHPKNYNYYNPHGALLHEIGHALGLNNSPVREAIMYRDPPLIQRGNDFQLHDDDIRGVQSLYGPPSSGTSWNRPQPPVSGSYRHPAPPSSRTSWNRPQPPVSGSHRRQAPTSSSSESSSTSSSQASSSSSSSDSSDD